MTENMVKDEWAGCKADKCPYGKEYGDCDTCSYLIRKPNIIDGEVITGRRMSDGEPVTGFVIGTTPFTYILPEDEVRKACCTGEQQVKIEITAERILAHD